jgi:hypothetical protein
MSLNLNLIVTHQNCEFGIYLEQIKAGILEQKNKIKAGINILAIYILFMRKKNIVPYP